ncbi:hypothetical protein ACF06V_28210 [Streptomyces bobili]|uniref:hypothetical protein n=1 Tax=Streptomyces bobili TaxID=67280 RepID=UPI0036F6E6BA
MLANACVYVFDVATRAIARTDRLTPDDIGLLPVGEDAAEASHRIIDAADERRSIAVTSNIHPQASTRSRRRLSWAQAPTASCATLTS